MGTDIMAVPDDVNIITDTSGDWLAVYVGGKAVYQGHSIEPGDLLDLIGIDYKTREADAVALGGQFPHALRDLDAPPAPRTVERDWCDACKDDPAGQRWLCPKRPHLQVPA